MAKALKAIYEKSVFRPLEPVDLDEHQEITLIVENAAPENGKTPDAVSAFDILQQQGLIGVIDDAPADLSTNKAHFDSFGQ